MTNPFYIIYNIENSALKDVIVQPGIIDFSDRFNKALANYNQYISRIRDLERFRENLCTENIESSQIIVDKLRVEQQKPPEERNFQKFLASFDENNPKEKKAKLLANKFYNYSYTIHYQLIGSRNSSKLKNFYHILEEEISNQRKKFFKKLKIFSWIFFIFILILLLGFILFFGIKFRNIEQFICLVLVSAMLSLIYHYKYLIKHYKTFCNIK